MPVEFGRIDDIYCVILNFLKKYIRIAGFVFTAFLFLIYPDQGLATEYYVNDSSTNLDEWCTGAGNDANDGLAPATPKATVQAVIDAYDLEPGDVVHIDTGKYSLNGTIVVGQSDQGSESEHVIFEGSPYGVEIGFDPASSNYSVFTVSFYCKGITIRTAESDKYPDESRYFMKIIGGYNGIYLVSTVYCTISNLEISSNANAGLRVLGSNVKISNNLIHNNGASGIEFDSIINGVITNNTIIENGTQIGLDGQYSNITMKNNIICADGPESYGIYRLNGIIEYSDYNLIYTTNGALTGFYGSDLGTIEDWRAATGEGVNSFSFDPKFVDPDNGDYHLKSTGGSYHGGDWAAEGESSPGINAGDPLDDSSDEPVNNGNRINLGAYGGTEQASKNPSGRELVLPVLNGGEVIFGTYKITWLANGQAWQSDDTVKLDYSINDGDTWNIISQSISVEDGFILWDTTRLPDNSNYIIRVSYTGDTEIFSQSNGAFTLHNTHSHYYVNDLSTELDEWCTAVGDDANDGLSTAAPKYTVQSVLDVYDLKPGDVVHIDTGSYTLSSDIEVTVSDQGAESAPVVFEASPYGVIVDRNSEIDTVNAVFNLYFTRYVTVTTIPSNKYPDEPRFFMKFTGGSYGIKLDNAAFISINRLDISGNGTGIYISESTNNILSNNLIYNNNGGIRLSLSTNNQVINNTIFKNNAQIYIEISENSTIKNNIIWADGLTVDGFSHVCIESFFNEGYAPVIQSDYNLFYATNDASIGTWGNHTYYKYTTLEEWQDGTNGDYHSLLMAPGFVDPENGDYHLKSTKGSYHNGAWTHDTQYSPGIDSGDPSDDYNNEPEDNGNRINIGAYGGTEQASKTDPDSDNDGIFDVWEKIYFGDLERDGTEDFDDDGLTDAAEYQTGTNPTLEDTDSDGMPDGWEVQNDFDPLFDDANKDADGDGYSNLKEYLLKTDPNDFNSHPSKSMPWLPLLLENN